MATKESRSDGRSEFLKVLLVEDDASWLDEENDDLYEQKSS